MSDEAAIENEIQAKGLNAPRLTPALIDSTIVAEQYHTFPGTTLTVCALTLRNGFNVTGESAAASPENFDEEIGRKIARENAREKIWAFEGYLLREKLSQSDTAALDARLANLEVIGEQAGLFKPIADPLAREAAYQDQLIRQWAVERASGHMGHGAPEAVVAFAQKLVDFVQGVRTVKVTD
jgi:hypothetical protein